MRDEQSDEAVERLVRFAGPRPTVDEERVRRVRGAVHEVWRASVRQRIRIRRWTIGGVGLAAAAGVVLAVSLGRRGGGPTLSPAPAAPAARLVAATGPIGLTAGSAAAIGIGDAVPIGAGLETGAEVLAALTLAGGGEVRVNQRTIVRFVNARELSIDRGALYIDSGSRGGSLIVRTPLGEVRDVGTRFEVGLVNGTWRVRVREGSVRYERGGEQHDAAAGAELLVSPGGPVVKRPAPMYGPDWAWIVRAAAPLQVEGKTLAAFLDWVARESGRRIEFVDERIRRSSRQTILHGSIEGLTAEEALDVILPTCGLTHRIESQRVIVSSAEPGSPNPEPRTPNPEPRTPNPSGGIQYSRLDLRGDRTFNYGTRRLTLFVEVINVLNRTNVAAANGVVSANGRAFEFTDTMFPLLPSAGIRIDF